MNAHVHGMHPVPFLVLKSENLRCTEVRCLIRPLVLSSTHKYPTLLYLQLD